MHVQKSFDLNGTLSQSIWFNPWKTELNETLLHEVQLITHSMDRAVESMVGYLPRDASWTRPVVAHIATPILRR